MRPYFAVLKDSFREALASRVLWILLIVTTLILLAASPAGFKEVKTTRLKRNTIRNWPNLAARIQDQAGAQGPSPGRQIWNRISPALQTRLGEAAEQTPGELSGEVVEAFADELNGIIGSPGLYDPAAFESTTIGREAQELIDKGVGSAAGEETSRLNRLLLENAYASEFRKGENIETFLVYLWLESDALPFTHQQLTQTVKAFLAFIIDYAVGVFGVFAAILVTASIIPQMFEAGAIDLLLSKPVSRVLLFLTKFLGGCIFIGLIASYAIAGIWLITGARFGVWSGRLFLCIPVVLFLFAVYYGVSALAGVLWRNAIVSVVITILFWALCFSIGATKGYLQRTSIDPERLVKLIPAGKSFLAVNEVGQVLEWTPRSSTWEEVFPSAEPQQRFGPIVIPQPIYGPVYDASQDRIVAIPGALPIPGPGGALNMFAPPPPLLIGKRAAAWNRKKQGTAPAGTLALFAAPGDQTIAVTKGAAFRLTREKRAKAKGEDPQEKFVRLGPQPALRLDSSSAVGMQPDSGALAIFNRGTLTVLEAGVEGQYTRASEKEVATAKDVSAAAVAFGGKTILLALSDGRIVVIGLPDLEVKREFRPFGDNAPRLATAAAGGRWLAVLYRNHKLWIYDAREDRPADLSFSGQGDISAVAFDGPNQLVTADLATRVTQYELDPFQLGPRRAPALSNVENAYHYGFVPLYTVLPKPGELGNAVEYLLTDRDDAETTSPDLPQERSKVDVAGPIWSSVGFLAVVLSLSCLYVWRSDF
jgi:ABC-2 family transporter protein